MQCIFASALIWCKNCTSYTSFWYEGGMKYIQIIKGSSGHTFTWMSLSFVISHVNSGGNVFIMSVCACKSVCLCVSVQAITFQAVNIETSFLYGGTSWPYLGQVWVSRSLSQCQGHVLENAYLATWTSAKHVKDQGHKLGQGHQGQGFSKVKLYAFYFLLASGRWAFDWAWKAFLFLYHAACVCCKEAAEMKPWRWDLFKQLHFVFIKPPISVLSFVSMEINCWQRLFTKFYLKNENGFGTWFFVFMCMILKAATPGKIHWRSSVRKSVE